MKGLSDTGLVTTTKSIILPEVTHLHRTIAVNAQKGFTFFCKVGPFPLKQMDHCYSVGQCLRVVINFITERKKKRLPMISRLQLQNIYETLYQ